ncbi:FAD-dependent oxidoreductase [Aliikangiella marina]|uniref:FAD-dependent oxidoreductase n=1 Tax=Aliikangiella marina TaxID=1712262 RepID=A0A545T451_9GAMM|nr:FAD-dependent oxidoreductase [Aliikangiella marina]TQV72007.1 FAD-dependent oxidoreductase [Aliikangiella marina]TQV72060.1 FAD-dependent oxidoreductase [Aliikangiella marina]
MTQKTTIIGGGVIGLAIAYYLAEQGVSVRLIDQKTIGSSCALGSAGYVSPSHFIPLAAPGMVKKGLKWMFDPESPFYIHPRLDMKLLSWLWLFNRHCTEKHVSNVKRALLSLCLESRELYVALNQELNKPIDLVEKGVYVLCQTDKGMTHEREVLADANQLGLKASEVSRETLADRYPSMDFNIAGSVYFPEDAHVQPGHLIESLYHSLKSKGVELVENCEVTRIECHGNTVSKVISHDNEYHVEQLVMAAGSWSSQLGQQLKLSIPVQAGKGYSLTLDNPWELDTPMILSEGAVAITPFGKQIRFGGTMEFSGINLGINPRRVKGILKSVSRFFNDFDWTTVDISESWAGLRPCSPDGLPMIGHCNQFENLIVATGHAMLGVTLAPVTGKIVCDLITGKQGRVRPEIDVRRFV